MDLSQIAQLILYLGTAPAINWIVSNILDNIPAFVTLGTQAKSTLVFILALVLSIGSYAILKTVPSGVFDQIQPIYIIIYGTVAAWLSGQIQHARFELQIKQGRHASIAAHKKQVHFG